MLTNEDLNSYGFNLKSSNFNICYDSIEDITDIEKTILNNRLVDEEIVKDLDIEAFYYKHADIYKEIDKLKDIGKGAHILKKALDNNKNVLCVTDYDLDGISSAVVLYKSLLDVLCINPNKLKVIVNKRRDGNGFTPKLVERVLRHAEKHKVDLIITADHGSVNEDAYKIFKEKIGCEIIVTDHHQVPMDNYPHSADAFINPMREDSTFIRDISGCATAFLLMVKTHQIMFNSKSLSFFKDVLPFVAISTIGDVMSLKHVINRYFVKIGLNELNSYGDNKLWLALKKTLGIPGLFTVKDIGFKLGPLINTGNRLGVEDDVYDLLITTDYYTAMTKADEINKLNAFRKNTTKNLMAKVKDKVLQNQYTNSVVVTIETNLAVNGIVAANISEGQRVPTVCFIDNGDKDVITGSSRSPSMGPDIVEVFKAIEENSTDVLIGYGGHSGAAGCSIYTNKIEEFRELFDRYCYIYSMKIDKTPYIEIDAIIDDKIITPDFINKINTVGPYGKDWKDPIFLSKLTVGYMFQMGSMYKIIFKLSNGLEVEGMYKPFDSVDLKSMINSNDKVYVAYSLNIDSYNNMYNIMLSILSIKTIEGV